MNNNMTRLGNVYEKKAGEVPKRFDGVYFSTYDFYFYDRQGNLLDEINTQYSRHDFLLSFDFGECVSPSGEKLTAKGNIITPLRLGDLVRQYKPASPEEINLYQDQCYVWIEEWGFDRTDPIFKKIHAIDYALISIICAPDIPLKRQRLQLLFWIIIFLFDDIMDNFAQFNNGKLMPLHEIHECTEIFCSIIKGDICNIEDITTDYCFPYFAPLCNSLRDYRQETIKVSGSLENAKHFVRSWITYMRSVIWGTADDTAADTELANTDPGFITRAYFFKRSITIGMDPNFELICLLRGFALPKQLRENPLFSYLNYHLCLYTAFVNDVVSVRKELTNGEAENFILLHRDSSTIQQHFNEAINTLNNLVIDYNEIAKRLSLLWPDDTNVQTYIQYGRGWMVAQWQWMTMTNRYGVPPLDCHIIL